MTTSKTRVFWASFAVLAAFNAVATVAVLAFGLASGYEGKFVVSSDKAGEAVRYLFGGIDQLFAFIGIITLVAVAVWGAIKLSKDGHHRWMAALLVAAFIVGGLTFRLLAVGEQLVPILVFVAFTAMEAGLIALLATRQRSTH